MAKPKVNTKAKATPAGASSEFQLEYIIWVVTFFLSTVIYVAVARLIVDYYNPSIEAALAYAKDISVIQSGFAPEPKEKLLFIAAILIYIACLPSFYYLSRKYLRKVHANRLKIVYSIVMPLSLGILLFITYKGLIAPNPFTEYGNKYSSFDVTAKTNFDFYFLSTFIYNYFYLFLLAIFPIILFGFIYDYKFSKKTVKLLSTVKRYSVYTLCFAIIVVVFLICSFRLPYTFENKYDFNAVYYSIVQVFRGTPLLVDGFTNTYGLYPHFIVPVIKLFGLSVLSVSSLFGLLLCLCFALFFFFLKKTVRNDVLILFGFTGLFFNSYIYQRTVMNYDAYFAIAPIRWLFPAFLLVYALSYLKNRSKKKYFISLFFFSAGILWNPDFGLLTYASLIAFYSYLEWEHKKLKIVIKNIFIHIAYALLALAVTFLAYSLIIKVSYGKYPDLLKIFSAIKIFSLVGYNMLPMPADYHPWMLVAIIYVIGLLYSLSAIIKKKISFKSTIVFLLSTLGIACFSYYQGRSHNWNLFSSSFPVFLLLTIFADELYSHIKTHKYLIAPFAVVLFFLSFSLFQTVYGYNKITALIYEKENKRIAKEHNINLIADADFIRGETKKNEKVFIFSTPEDEGYLYDLSHTAAVVNPGAVDRFFKSDYEEVLSSLFNNDSAKVFFDLQNFTYHDSKIPVTLSCLYNVSNVQENGTFMLLTRKKENPASQFVLNNDSSVVHELFDKNYSNKLSYAFGQKGKITLGAHFSVEIIFKPIDIPSSERITDKATLLCNVEDDRGFSLLHDSQNKNQYIFSIGGNGVFCPVVLNQWNYLAFEVDDSVITAYSNGQFAVTMPVKKHFKDSEAPLYVGNYKTAGRFFFGDIKEVKIAKKPLVPGNIALTWNSLKNSL